MPNASPDRPLIALTGGTGVIGTLIRPLLPERYDVRLLCAEPTAQRPGEEHVSGTLADLDALDTLLDGVDALVHLAGISSEGEFDPMIDTNIRGTAQILSLAQKHGVRNVLVASSAHAVGGLALTEAHGIPMSVSAPTSWYGASKVAVEAIAEVFAHRNRARVVVARIGTCLAEPRTERHLSTWLSPADMVRLIDTTVSLRRVGCFKLWAVSANSRRHVDLGPGRRIGFAPVDDAERFADEVLARGDDSAVWERLGGPWTGPDPDVHWPDEQN